MVNAYLLYRPDDHTGVDLIAVILGVASTRQFLFGNIPPPQATSVEHIRHFAKLLFLGLRSISVLAPKISKYFVSEEDVLFADYAP